MQIAENPSLTTAITDFVSNAIVVGEETEQVAFNMVDLNKLFSLVVLYQI